MNEPLVSVVIPCYNRKKDIIECIKSLKNCNYKNYEIIVVDDASTDGSFEELNKLFPEIILLRNEINTMAAGARNKGLSVARGKYVLFLDCDNILAPEFLTELVKLAESDDNIGMIGPKMYYHENPDILWYAGADINLFTGKTTYTGLNQIDKGQYDQIRPTGHVPNAFFTRRSAAVEVDGLDESYVMSYAESDFAAKIKKKGYNIIFCPTAITYHKVPFIGKSENPLRGFGIDAPRRAYYFSCNRALYMKRHASFPNFLFFILFFYPFYTIIISAMMLRYWSIPALKKHLKGAVDGYLIAFRGIK